MDHDSAPGAGDYHHDHHHHPDAVHHPHQEHHPLEGPSEVLAEHPEHVDGDHDHDHDLDTKQEDDELALTAVAAMAAASIEQSEVHTNNSNHHETHHHHPHMLAHAPEDPTTTAATTATTTTTTAPAATESERNSSKPPNKRRRTTTVPSKKNFSLASARPFNDMLFDLIHYKTEHGDLKVPASHKLYPWVYELRRKMRTIQQQQQQQQQQHLGTTNHSTHSPTKQQQHHHQLVFSTGEPQSPCDLTLKRVTVLNHLGFVWDTFKEDAQQKWNSFFQQLTTYKKQHGHCNVPAKEGELGAWVKQQRYCKTVADQKEAGTLRKSCKSGAMSKERQAQLESIGFQWKVAPPITGWNNRYDQLVAYKAANGHCNVPQYYKPDKYFGRWVMKQRHEHSLKLRGLKSQLTDEREQKLNAIGFRWVAPGFQKKSVEYHPEDEEDEANNNRTRNNASNHAPVPGILPAPHFVHHHHQQQQQLYHYQQQQQQQQQHIPTHHAAHQMMVANGGHHHQMMVANNGGHHETTGQPQQQQPTIEEQAAALAMDV